MTFLFGVLGALLMIGSFFAGSALAVAETADKREGRTPTPVDRAWTAKFKFVVRIGFWGGLSSHGSRPSSLSLKISRLRATM